MSVNFDRDVEVLSAAELAELSLTESLCLATFNGGRRVKEEVDECWAIGLDYDDGKMSLDAAKTAFSAYTHIILTTKSHQKEKVTPGGQVRPACDRFRVILFFSKPVKTNEDFRANWLALDEKFKGIDKAAKDITRYFGPARETVSVREDGLLIEPVAAPLTMHFNWTPHKAGAGERGQLSRRTMAFLLDGAATNWNAELNAAAYNMKSNGYSMEEAIERFEQMSNPFFTGELDATDLRTIQSAFESESNGPIIWPKYLRLRDGNFAVDKNSPENMRFLITNILGFKVEKNEIDGQVLINRRHITDGDLSTIRNEARRQQISPVTEFVIDAIEELSRANSFHPFKELVEATPWDGVDHIAKLFKTLQVADSDLENAAIYEEYLRRWLIGAIAKVYQPGSQNLVLTFRGSQGQGKSRWLQRLLPIEGYVGEGGIDPENKDHVLRHLNYILWHISELDGTTRKRDIALLKDYITKSDVSARPSYGRFDRKGKSILSFCASVNANEFLVDMTGNRRFLVIPLYDLDANHSVNVQQVWAQALALYKAGKIWWFEKHEISIIEDLNGNYKVADPVEDLASRVIDSPNWISTTDLLAELSSHSSKPTQAELTKFGMALASKGIKSARKSVNGTTLRGYYAAVAKPGVTKNLQVVKTTIGPKSNDS